MAIHYGLQFLSEDSLVSFEIPAISQRSWERRSR